MPNAALYAATASGGRVTRLTSTSGEIDKLAASSDGKRIAYVAATYEYGAHRHVTGAYVHVMNADGSGNRTVYSCPVSYCSSLQWSPDGRRLLVSGHVVIAPDGRDTDLCDGSCDRHRPPGGTWSPDGKRIAFLKPITLHRHRGTSTVYAVATADTDGSDVRMLTNQHCTVRSQGECTYDGFPVWSPNGEQIAFARLQPTFLRLDQSRGLGPFGPTGVFTVSTDGTDISERHSCGHNARPTTLQWSPAGDDLAFVCRPDSFRNDTMTSTVGVATATSHSVGVVTVRTRTSQANEDGLAPVVAWAPSGTALAVVAPVVGNPSSLYLIRVHETTLSPLRLVRRNAFKPLVWLPATR